MRTTRLRGERGGGGGDRSRGDVGPRGAHTKEDNSLYFFRVRTQDVFCRATRRSRSRQEWRGVVGWGVGREKLTDGPQKNVIG